MFPIAYVMEPTKFGEDNITTALAKDHLDIK